MYIRSEGVSRRMSRRTARRRVEKLLTRRLSKCPMESDVDLVWWRWSWRFVWWSYPSCVALGSFVCAWVIKRFVLGDVVGEVHGDVPFERWKVEALTQGEFSKNGFIEEVWKDCSCVKIVSSGAAGWDLCMRA
ncbi:hypothetical protein F2Q68_00001690 [Brassica cretica]|uniref:Uncharacterized protein n=1 Tax=Brassica cretica TaxID=69181 RepID=A0A8S9J6M1_BRACR|nr:hypothetical protein F2Q68_00001690 [Brassica cretica]